MTATFDYSGDPAASPKDAVRFLLRDVTSPMSLSNEEIAWLLSEYGNEFAAAGYGADIIASKYSGLANKTVGPFSINYKDLFDRYTALGTSLRLRNSRKSGGVAILTQKSIDKMFTLGKFDYRNVNFDTFPDSFPSATLDVTTSSDSQTLQAINGVLFSFTVKYWNAGHTALVDTSAYKCIGRISSNAAPNTVLLTKDSSVGGSGLTSPQPGEFDWTISAADMATLPTMCVWEMTLVNTGDPTDTNPFAGGFLEVKPQVIP